MVTGYSRGNPIKYINNQWVYEDSTPITEEERPCVRCGCMPTPEGYDACLGHINGASSACCGHGVEKGYILKDIKSCSTCVNHMLYIEEDGTDDGCACWSGNDEAEEKYHMNNCTEYTDSPEGCPYYEGDKE